MWLIKLHYHQLGNILHTWLHPMNHYIRIYKSLIYAHIYMLSQKYSVVVISSLLFERFMLPSIFFVQNKSQSSNTLVGSRRSIFFCKNSKSLSVDFGYSHIYSWDRLIDSHRSNSIGRLCTWNKILFTILDREIASILIRSVLFLLSGTDAVFADSYQIFTYTLKMASGSSPTLIFILYQLYVTYFYQFSILKLTSSRV